MSQTVKTVRKLAQLPKIAKRKRVAAYARVSSDKYAMRHSLSAQISYYSAYIGRHPQWEFAGIYADEPTTGTKDNRAQFQRLLTDCRAGLIDMVITKSVTRFARNTLTTLDTLRELKSIGVDVFFDKENIHSISGDGELMLTLLASYAQEESLSVSENCKWRIRRMFRIGRPNTGHMLGYRLRDGKLTVVPKEALIVQQIFADYLAGMGSLSIAKKLNSMGIRARYGGLWSETPIAKILRNEKYAGDLILQKTYSTDHLSKSKRVNYGELPKYYVKDSHERIIEREIFDAVQREIRRRAEVCALTKQGRRRKAQGGPYPFTGLILCGNCGRLYRRKCTAIGTKYEKIVWICNTFNTVGRDVCPSKQIPDNILTDAATKALGLRDFNATILSERVEVIRVAAHDRLVFVFKDAQSIEIKWQNPSRRESWSQAAKQTARQRAIEQHERRRQAQSADTSKEKLAQRQKEET
jgi:DNA invertase Pin-like site-specific DNA recombinase